MSWWILAPVLPLALGVAALLFAFVVSGRAARDEDALTLFRLHDHPLFDD